MSITTHSGHQPELLLKKRQGLSQRILDVLYDHAQATLLQDDELSLTGEQTLKLMARLKHTLEMNVPPRGRVGVLFRNSTSQALAILTCLVSDRVPVILNTNITTDALKKQWDAMRLHGFMISEAMEVEAPKDIPIIVLSTTGSIQKLDGNPIYTDKAFPREGTALILYTSGSSGEPKGVEVPAAGLTYTIDYLIRYFNLNEQSVAAVTLPMYHTMALNTQFLPTFFAGGRSCFIETDLSLGHIYRNIIQSKGTFAALIGDMLRLCAEEKIRRQVEAAELVTDVQLAGGVIRREHLDMAMDLFPNAKVHKGYGLTEAIRVSMINSADPLFMSDTAGYPLPGQEIQIRDEEGRTLPLGVLGQVYVKGPNVMKGYDGVSEPCIDETGFLATGDLGVLTHDKRLVIHGRLDSIFKSQGRRVSAKEIERIALEDPNVRDARCLPVADIHKGFKPVLFVEVHSGKEKYFEGDGKNRFEGRLKKELENYKVPKDIFVIPRFPRTSNGKVINRELEYLWSNREKSPDLGQGKFGCRFKGVPTGYVGVRFK